MPRMLKDLESRPELGLLHYRLHFSLRSPWVVQYWESFEQLGGCARARDSALTQQHEGEIPWPILMRRWPLSPGWSSSGCWSGAGPRPRSRPLAPYPRRSGSLSSEVVCRNHSITSG